MKSESGIFASLSGWARQTWRVLSLLLLIGAVLAPAVLADPGGPSLRQGNAVCLPFVTMRDMAPAPMPTPMLTAPTDGATLSTIAPAFSWAAQATDAEYLVLQMAKTAAFTSPIEVVLTKAQADALSYQLRQNLDPGETYYWRASWQGDTSPASRWGFSGVWSFTTGSGGTMPPAPTLAAPVNGIGIELPAVRPYVTVEWNPVAGAVEYLVVAQERPNGTNAGLLQVDGQRYEEWIVGIEYDVRVMANSDWDWYVVARNAYGVSAPSETWYFFVD